MELDLQNPLTISQDEQLPALFLAESHHMPFPHYYNTLKTSDFHVSVRTQIVSFISQLSCNFDPLLCYLAVNYLDRFLSRQGIPSKQWMGRLLAISCLSLAAKMKKTELSLCDLQCDGGFIFDPLTIQRMEMLILGALKWRMRSITPFSFISFFITPFKLEDPPLLQTLRARATEIIIIAQKDIKLLEFKPSVLAASAILSATHELLPFQFPCFKKSISNSSFLNKENMLRCFEVMEETLMDRYRPLIDGGWSRVTPENVLDLQFSSCCESEKTRRRSKRRKISGCWNNQTVQISQTQNSSTALLI